MWNLKPLSYFKMKVLFYLEVNIFYNFLSHV